MGTPVTPSRTGRSLRVIPSRTAGFENFTNGLVSSRSHRLMLKEPPSRISRFVTALRSTDTATSTGSIATWVTQLAVIPFHSSPERDPTRHSTLGMRQSTLLTVSASTAGILRYGIAL